MLILERPEYTKEDAMAVVRGYLGSHTSSYTKQIYSDLSGKLGEKLLTEALIQLIDDGEAVKNEPYSSAYRLKSKLDKRNDMWLAAVREPHS